MRLHVNDYMYQQYQIHFHVAKTSLPILWDSWKGLLNQAQAHVFVCFIYTHLVGCNAQGVFIDVAGVPGTGKTATVHEVIRHLQYRVEQKVGLSIDSSMHVATHLHNRNCQHSTLWKSTA